MDHQLEVMETTITTPGIFQPKLRSQFCNTPYTQLTTLNQTLYATVPAYDPNLEEWEYKFSSNSSGITYSITTYSYFGYSGAIFSNATDANGNAINESDTEFQVNIRIKVNGTWGNYGETCVLKTLYFQLSQQTVL